jgi:uncharacterized protein YbjT (DUF2867 family)
MVKTMGVLAAPAPSAAPLALVATADVGGYAAQRLATPNFEGFEVVNLLGPRMLTFAEVTAAIGKAVGKLDLAFVQTSYEEAARGMVEAGVPRGLADLYVEMYQGAAQGLLAPETGTPVVHTATTFEQFAEAFAKAYRAAA